MHVAMYNCDIKAHIRRILLLHPRVHRAQEMHTFILDTVFIPQRLFQTIRELDATGRATCNYGMCTVDNLGAIQALPAAHTNPNPNPVRGRART